MVSPAPRAEPGSIGWRAVVPAIAAVTVSILPGFLTAGLAVQISEDIGLSVAGLGVVLGLFFGVSALASSFMGALVQRRGWAAGVRVSSVVAAVTLAGIGLSARTPLTLALWFVLGGLAAAMAQPAANLAIERCVSRHRHGFLFGVKHASVPAATLLGGLAVPVVGLTVGWEWAFVGCSALALLVVLAVPRRSADHEEVRSPTDPGSEHGRPTMAMSLLVALAVAAILGIGAMDAMAAFLVTYSVDIGISEGTAGLLLAAGSLAGITTRLIAGRLIDRTHRADLTAVAVMLVIGSCGVAVIAAGGRPGLLIGGLLGFAAGWGWSGLFTFSVVKYNPGAAATATGITMTGVWIGAAVGPPLFGVVADSVSFEAAWWMTVLWLLGAAVIMHYVRARR